jgi:hypothetical protein
MQKMFSLKKVKNGFDQVNKGNIFPKPGARGPNSQSGKAKRLPHIKMKITADLKGIFSGRNNGFDSADHCYD